MEQIAHLRQVCHNKKFVIFQEKLVKILKCYNFLWVQRRNICSPAASFVNCVTTLYLLKVHLQTFHTVPITQKCQILICDTLVANERYITPIVHTFRLPRFFLLGKFWNVLLEKDGDRLDPPCEKWRNII